MARSRLKCFRKIALFCRGRSRYDRDIGAVVALGDELHVTGRLGEQRVVGADTDVFAWPIFGCHAGG